MPDQLTPVWNQVEKLLLDGISVIPVRDKDETMPDGSLRVKKSPYNKWKQFQTRIATKQELFYLLEQNNTTAVAMICGRISGNLEVIDIDVKWYPGVDALLFKDIRDLYPDLFSRLRIHQSPSGGYHIIYRVEQDFILPGNQKLASRLPSEKELKINPKEKVKCFFETRGEGGYVLAPPSMGYLVYSDNLIPVLTISERESLINLCQTYNQIIKIDKITESKTPYKDNYYSTNPFEHFNLSPAGENVLLDNGWKYEGKGGNYIRYTRPPNGPEDKKTSGVSAGFLVSKRIFHFFTSSTDFDNNKGKWYSPASVLAIILFGGDKKRTYQHLVQQGYGVIKPGVEASIVKRKALQGKPLPPNVSQQAAIAHTKLVNQYSEQYPHGIFWVPDEDAPTFSIDREGLYQVAAGLGFRYNEQRDEIVQIRGYFIHRCSERMFFDSVKIYISEEDAEVYKFICNTYEAFIQRSGSFSITRIQLLDTSSLIVDTPQTCYKFFLNGYVFITAEQYTLNPYENIAGSIWYDRVQQRNFTAATPGGRYLQFLQLAANYDQQPEYIQRIIGYLCHEYKDETTGYIPVFTEQCEDPKQGGGSGKNIFVNILNHSTTVRSIPGEQVRYDAAFMQAWDGERVFCVSDSPKNFNFIFLKELSTGTGIWKKLWKDEVVVPVSDMPKFIVLTNYSFEIKDGGLRRRIIPLEFTNFFTNCGGVDVHFGCHFPNGWTAQDWGGYDNLIATSVQTWLAGRMKLSNQSLSETGWLKQFDQSYMAITRQFIEENWTAWCTVEFISNNDFNTQYNAFILENNVAKTFSLSSTKMNRALIDWSEKNAILMRHNATNTVNGVVTKGRFFLPVAPF